MLNSKTLAVFITLLMSINLASGQDCIDYHRITCPKLEPNPYTEVPEGSKSELLLRGEELRLSFFIFQGRDYRLTLCSEMYAGIIVVKLYDFEDQGMLLYDNTLNEMAQEFEFQVMRTRKVQAVIYVPKQSEKSANTGMLLAKVPRGCVGMLTETMVTRK